MKSFIIGDTIYKYIADTWVQAEKMLANELEVSVWELPSFKFTRYEL